MAEMTSRYYGLSNKVDDAGKQYLSTLLFPEFIIANDDITHIVKENEIGRLDILSQRYYNTPNLWWVIARVNNIKVPEDDMASGQYLTIPNYQNVLEVIRINTRK